MQTSTTHSHCPTLKKTTQKKIRKNGSKKIVLGGPPTSDKMTVQELKALSRQVKMPKQDDILTISRHLRHNLAKAKDKMMHSLKNSSVTQDVEMYENLKTCPPTPLFEYEDDCSSVSSASSLPTQQPSQALIDPGLTDIASLYSSLLYTPLYTSLLDMNLMLQSGLEMSATNSIEATEEQINSWLQRGGGGTLSPIASLATDQELADLLDFDSSS